MTPPDDGHFPRALEGLRVVDLSQNLAGPYCTQILADLGADVIKVERPGAPDPARAWGPPFAGADAVIFLAANRNKRSVSVDLKATEGAALFGRLLEGADVLVDSFRPGVMDRLGWSDEAVRAGRPALIHCTIAAYGARGPLSDLPGYDPLMQAHGGLMSVTGEPGRPARVGTSVVDMGTGMWAAIAVLAALRQRDATGRGARIVAPLYEAALAWNAYHLMGYIATGEAPGASGTAFGLIAPYEAFPTSDGQLMIAAANDGLFNRLARALEVPDLAVDPRFAENASRVAHREELAERLSGRTRLHSTSSLSALLVGAGVPCAPILGIDEVAGEPQTLASGMVVRDADSGRPGLAMVGLPFEWDGTRSTTERPPPAPGEHTGAVLEELGLAVEEIGELKERGVVG